MKKKVIYSLASFALACAACGTAFAQVSDKPEKYEPLLSRNTGLKTRQEASTMPVSEAKVVFPERKAKQNIPGGFTSRPDGAYVLSQGWELASGNKVIASGRSAFDPSIDRSDWYNATVPGTVLTTMVEQGVFPDPYYGLNNMAIPDTLCRTDWWYRNAFKLPRPVSGQRLWLNFDGINYMADIWLNGRLLGKIKGAFHRGSYDVTDIVKSDGENILAVHIFPPFNPGTPHEQSARTGGYGPNGGQLCMDGPTFISSEGWDWIPGIRDRNIGIWQDVSLVYTGAARLGDPHVVTDLELPDTTRAFLTVGCEVENVTSKPMKVTLEGQIEKVKFSQEATIPAGEVSEVVFDSGKFPELVFKNPRLWWPNGYGDPALYTASLTLKDQAGNVLDKKDVRFGIRKFTYEMTVDTKDRIGLRIEYDPMDAARLGKPIIDRGYLRKVGKGMDIPSLYDYVPQDMIHRVDNPDMQHFLVIKVNGVPVYCRGGNWGMDDGMKRVSRERLEPALRLHKDAGFNIIRNWTGETTEKDFYDLCDEYGMLVWNDFWYSTEGFNMEPNDADLFLANVKDVVKRFRNHPSIVIWCPRNEGYAALDYTQDGINDIVIREDGTRYYVPNSRAVNMRPSGPWHYSADNNVYFEKIGDGFNSEVGTIGMPTAESMRKFLPVEDQWPITDAWYYHDFHRGQTAFIEQMNKLYGEAKDLDDFCKKSQLLNYDANRAIFESWNSRLWKSASGALLWMSHPAWPSMTWQTYSWDFETPGAYFGSLKSCEPVHIQMNLNDDKIVAVNATLKSYPGARASLSLYDLSGKRLSSRSVKIDVKTNAKTDCFTGQLPKEGVYLARVELKDAKGNLLSTNDYWKTATDFKAFNDLDQVRLSARLVKKSAGKASVRVSNPSKTMAVTVKLNLKDNASGQTILPAYFSDGYFNLLPGQSKVITVESDRISSGASLGIATDGYNLQKTTILSF